MSTHETLSATAPADQPSPPCVDIRDARQSTVGDGLTVRRALPMRRRRTIGAWCFLDHFGPASLSDGQAMDVAQHPHIGLQTVTWLLQGEVLHKDSLGSLQTIRPGQLNVMTSGRAIAHTEESPEGAPDTVHGVQLWVALPDAHRHTEPAFEHHAELPTVKEGAATVVVFLGRHGSLESPARTFSPLVGLEVGFAAAGSHTLSLDPVFEHGIIVVEGEATVDGQPVVPGKLAYLGLGRTEVTLTCDAAAKLVVVGGEPLGEEVLIWWNFVARDWSEIAEARAQWAAEERFEAVPRYEGGRLDAPALPSGVGG